MNKRRREDTTRLEAAKSQVQLCDNGEVTVNHTHREYEADKEDKNNGVDKEDMKISR